MGTGNLSPGITVSIANTPQAADDIFTSNSTGLTASPKAARSVIWLSRLRAARGYDPAVRVLGSAWFLLLALAVAMKVLADAEAMSIADFSPTGWPALLSSVCLFLFYLALYWITG